ncbi:MAG: hypothetical protein ABI689_13515 [Thermoanaerobaculia bacterium]
MGANPSSGRAPGGSYRPRTRLWAQRLAFLSVVALVLLVALELLLHFSPEVFGEQRANEIFSRYDTQPGGIYKREKRTRMRFMWPEFATENYWNGYRWRHETDQRGFRNPPGTAANVILLGDSLIYGHGVEEAETVAHFLHSDFRIGAYNMGRQGAALYDEYVYLRTWLPELSPQSIVLFVFLNDFDDLEVYRTADEILTMPEIDQIDYVSVREWNRRLPELLPSRPLRWLRRRPSLRLLLSVAKELRGVAFTAPAWAAESPAVPPFVAPLLDDARRARLKDYYMRILADLAERCRARAIELRVVYLGAGASPEAYEPAQALAVALVGDAAAASGLPFFDSRATFAGCAECFLPRDGHFSAAGHLRLARFVAETVLAGAPAR